MEYYLTDSTTSTGFQTSPYLIYEGNYEALSETVLEYTNIANVSCPEFKIEITSSSLESVYPAKEASINGVYFVNPIPFDSFVNRDGKVDSTVTILPGDSFVMGAINNNRGYGGTVWTCEKLEASN